MGAGEAVELFHFTSMSAAEKILESGVVRGTQNGLWGPGAYFGSSLSFGSLTKTFAWGLPMAKQEAVVGIQVAAKNVAWRPFGIRLVKDLSFKF